jgi:hypothetical protein
MAPEWASRAIKVVETERWVWLGPRRVVARG